MKNLTRWICKSVTIVDVSKFTSNIFALSIYVLYCASLAVVSACYFIVLKFSEPSIREKQYYADLLQKIDIAQKVLGQSYCILVLGEGIATQHHMECGRSDIMFDSAREIASLAVQFFL